MVAAAPAAENTSEHRPEQPEIGGATENESSTGPPLPKPKKKKKKKKKTSKSSKRPTDRGGQASDRDGDRARGGTGRDDTAEGAALTGTATMTAAGGSGNPGGSMLDDLEDDDDGDGGGGGGDGDGDGDDDGDEGTLNEAAAAERRRKKNKRSKKKKKKGVATPVPHPLAPTVPEAHPTEAWAQIDPADLVDSPHPSKQHGHAPHGHGIHGEPDPTGGPGQSTTSPELDGSTNGLRRTIGVLNASGFKRVSKRTLELHKADEDTDQGAEPPGGRVGAMMLQMTIEKATQTTLRYSVAVTLGFVLANQVFVDALLKGNTTDRFVDTYAEVSTSEAALLFVLLTLSLGALFESWSLDGPGGRHPHRDHRTPPTAAAGGNRGTVRFGGADAIGVLCLGIAMVLHLVMMKTDIELDRYPDYPCPQFLSDTACGLGTTTVPPGGAGGAGGPDPGRMNLTWEDSIDRWRSLNLARLIAVCVCGFGVLVVT